MRTLTSLLLIAAGTLPAQKPELDSLIFTNGEKLVGKFLRSSGAAVTFHSDSVGNITVDWAKIKELRAGGEYAVIGKGVDIKRAAMSAVPQGKVDMADQKIRIAEKSIPVADTVQIVDRRTFNESIVGKTGLFEKWHGVATGGASIVEATQTSRVFNASVGLVRALPAEGFLARRSRSTLNFSVAFGSTRQPGTTGVKTEIYHADGEHDLYFSPRAYTFVHASLDHNFSQGLDLQESAGGGLGVTVLKQARQELNIRASADFTRQQFSIGPNHNLFGAIFGDTYTRKLLKAVFLQQIQISPSFTQSDAYAANGTASISAPVYKKMSFTFGVSDAFVNNPPPGFKKNSFQATTGIAYILN